MIELEDSNEHKNNKTKQTETAKGGAHKIPTKDDQENPNEINRKAPSVTELNVKTKAESSDKSGGKKGEKNQKSNRIQESKNKKKEKPTIENIPQKSKTSKISKTSKSFKTSKKSKVPKISKISKDKRVPSNKETVLESNNNTSSNHKNMSDKNIIKNQKRKDLTVKIATAPVQNFNGREFKSVHSIGKTFGKRNQTKENSNLAKNGSIEGKSKTQGKKSKPGKYKNKRSPEKKSLNTSKALKRKSFNETSFQAIHIKGQDFGEGGNRLEKEAGNQSLSSHRGKDYSDDEQEETDKPWPSKKPISSAFIVAEVFHHTGW